MTENGRKIFVLGAGASIGSKRFPIESSSHQVRTTMPSADNFFYDIFKTNKTDNMPAGSSNLLGMLFEGINEFITTAWNMDKQGYDPEGWKGVNIEDVMTFIDVCSQMHPGGLVEKKGFQKVKKHLIDFMDPLIPMICANQHCEYLMGIFYDLKPRDSIISYNWDTIADFSLQRAHANQLKNYAKLLRSKSINPKKYKDMGILLKLHGSFNWKKCTNNKCEFSQKIIPPFQKNRYRLLRFPNFYPCPVCGSDRLESFIVPPVSNKMIYKDSFLRNQWLIAREQLVDVAELIFIGYSFPATDFYSEWLFRQLNFIEGKPEIKITVVNPEFGKRGSQVAKRYKTIFRGREIVGHKTLKDYVQHSRYKK